jgi:hypothetical protein
MESGFLEPRKMSECHIEVTSSDVDFEDERYRYMALAGHGDGFHISHFENFGIFLLNVSIVGCILRIIKTACYSMYKKTKLYVYIFMINSAQENVFSFEMLYTKYKRSFIQ